MKKIVFYIVIGMIAAIVSGVLIYSNKTNQKQGVIRIGIILPLTGELANFGNTVLDGINLKLSEAENEKSLEINVVLEDSKGQPNLALSAFNKLVNINRVNCVIGDLTSSATLALVPESRRRNILLISPTASNPALTNISPFFYRVYPSDVIDAKIAASYCFDNLVARNASIVYLNNDYSTGLKDEFTRVFTNLGGKIIETISFESHVNDFRTIIARIKNGQSDLVYIIGHPLGIANFLRQSKELNLDVNFFSNVAAEDREFLTTAGNAANGLYFTAPAFDLQSDDEKIQDFVSRFRKKYNYLPDVHAVKGYDLMTILMSSFDNGHFTSKEIKNFIDRTKIFHGISGEYRFVNGDVELPIAIKKYVNGEIVLLEKINPKE